MNGKNLKIKNRFLFIISFFLLITISCFGIINFLTGTKTFSELSLEKWDGVTIATSFSGGNGSILNPFKISNGNELAYFKSLIEGIDSNIYNDKYYSLSNNIDLDDNKWVSINKEFKGHFNGDGYKIQNFKILDSTVINDIGYYGIFSVIDNAFIENLNIDNVSIIPSNDSIIKVGVIASEASKTNISNVSINNLSIDLTNTSENVLSKIGGVVGSLENNSCIENLFIKENINSNYTSVGKIVGYLDSSIDNSVVLFNYSNIILNNINLFNSSADDKLITNSFIALFENNNFKILSNNEEILVNDLIDLLDEKSNSNYYWSNENDYLVVNKYEDAISDDDLVVKSFSFNRSASILLHETGIVDDTVYINDLDSDKKFYLAKNYTSSSDGTLPTSSNKNIYNDSNLVKVYTKYSGTDVNNSSLTGYVNIDSKQSNYIYYKYYEVIDGFVSFTLIDNPYYDRPNDKAFNGWVTDYDGANVFYDNNYYERNVRIPITYTNGIPDDVSITFYASWVDATVSEITSNSSSSWDNAFNNLNSIGMKKIGGKIPVYEDMSNYYNMNTVSYRTNYPSGSVNASGSSLSGRCNSWFGCTYYIKSSSSYNEGLIYYKLNDNSMSVYTPSIIEYVDDNSLPKDSVSAGFYKDVNVSYGSSISGYYDSYGKYQDSGVCNISSGCIYYDLIQYFDGDKNVNVVDDTTNYYYLVTRDTNIVVLRTNLSYTWDSENNKPFTLTSIYNDNNYTNYYFNVSYLSIKCYSDTVMENVYLYTTQSSTSSIGTFSSSTSQSKYFYGNFNNVKIGRGIKSNGSYVNFIGILGGSNSAYGSSNNIAKYKFIIESGYFSDGAIIQGGTSSDTYVESKSIIGSDYDRVVNDNSQLTFTDCLSVSWGGNLYASSSISKLSDTVYKSGKFGSKMGGNTSGIYAGQRQGGSAYALRDTKIEGGWFYVINGGPSVGTTMRTTNSVSISITNAEIYILFGGAGQTTTYGNRIIQMTGGKVKYAVFGGSNAYNDTSDAGTIYGSSYVYLAGDTIIGDEDIIASGNSSMYNAASGNVFGHGNGKDGSTVVGSNDNSTVIIDGNAHILGNVYGGSNNGLAGSTTNTNSTSVEVDILNGIVEGSVYGGGNNNGIGGTSVDASININMYSGTVNGSIYGGTRTKGIIYGTPTINIYGGKVNQNIYGGGEGGYVSSSDLGTYIRDNIYINIGNDIIGPTIEGNIYGGSAYGTVNAITYDSVSNDNEVLVNVNNGIIYGSVFGGAKGSSTITPYVKGNIVVNINGGNCGEVFGGFDASGTPENSNVVYLNGGIVGNAYGGGNNSSVSVANIYLQGSTITNLFGGSNLTGIANKSNVFVNSGEVSNIYGGNNVGGSTVTSVIKINGGKVTNNIYGGGKSAYATNTNIYLNSDEVNNVYGGSESSNATNTNVVVNGTKINNLYGGSNISGDVDSSLISVNEGAISNLYGGNNQGGKTVNSKIYIVHGSITNVYGGGNKAISINSNVNIYNGNIDNVYGGGNESGVTTSNVNLYGGTIINTYGGSNLSGDLITSNIKTSSDVNDSKDNDISISVSSSISNTTWQSSTYSKIANVSVTINNNTDAEISDWSGYIVIPKSEIFSNYSNTVLNKNGNSYEFSSLNSYYGTNTISANESYNFNFEVLLNEENIIDGYITNPVNDKVSYNSSKLVISNIYGGNNKGGKVETTNLNISSGEIGDIYGGGNEAVVGDTSVVISDGTIKNIYGGGNQASVNNNTILNLKNAYISQNIYGGGNQGQVSGNTNVLINSLVINGSLYAGGNGSTAIVKGNTTITIEGNTVIGTPSSLVPESGCVFGGGNAAQTGDSISNNSTVTVNIVGAKIYGNVYGGANTSVVYGKTKTNIGTNAVDDSSLIEGDINIVGTVFGGGEANAAGSDTYDYSFICVTVAISIDINGAGYENNNHDFLITGSIFGSGNASSSSGSSNIYISNLGTSNSPSRNISIQRADKVVLDKSVIELKGATDRTNEYSSIKYSFNRIDSLVIKNNTTLLLQQNANLLKELRSVVDISGKEEKAVVNINDDDKTVSKNVNNRIYLAANKNLNITTNEAATSYGKVSGMTFFGMYNSYANGSIAYGVYDNSFNYGDEADAGDAIIGGSYILGLHSLNHDTTVDGFYSNFLGDDYTYVTTAYIDPTPTDSNYYMWSIGLQAINYSFALTASKYSSLGTYELSMLDFSKGNTTFNVIGFNAEGLSNGVNLVDSSEVKKIASTPEEANSSLGLSMKTETSEWTSYGTTKLISINRGIYSGDNTYKTDNKIVAPSLMFYLYHAKNISLDQDLGTVVVSLQALTPKNEIEYDVQLITISIDIDARNYDDGISYDASITYDKKYEMPSATLVNITNKSQFTAYYSLFSATSSFDKMYGINNDYYHALVSSYVLPIGTTITMLDYGLDQNKPNYYYYTVTDSIYNNKLLQMQKDGEVTYKLSDFIKMGSTSDDNNYSDSSNNLKYYDANNKASEEEFLFIFDFKNTSINTDSLNNSILFELRNSEDRALISVLGIRQSIMNYNLYNSSNVVLNETSVIDSNYIYHNHSNVIDFTSRITYDQTANRESIIDTNYESSSMGINVSIFDNSDNQLSSSVLSGTTLKMDNKTYFVDSDGVYRIKLSGKVSNLNKKILMNTDSGLPAGIYKMKIALFASPDGLHNSDTLSGVENIIDVVVVGDNNAIIVVNDDKEKVIDGNKGLNFNNRNYNTYKVTYNSELINPNLRISLFKRNINSKDTSEYQEVNFNRIFTDDLLYPKGVSLTSSSEFERMVTAKVGTTNNLEFNLKDTITSGTYKLVFKLYDKNELIQDETKYIIVKKSIIRE